MDVNGIGGVFIYANDPRSLAEWYSRHLGIEFTRDETSDSYYMVFYYRDVDDPSKRLDTAYAIRPAKDLLGSDRNQFMINFRVNDLEALATQLSAAGIAVEEIQILRDEEGFGKFTQLVDLEGNHIELYQPLR
ncbi:MAG: hypothetical protein A2Z45_09965 [Chloroflexi bacterium RBG_19FT_COMBO_55_16]|nr:MAG: hypothetical protein A2Z45_09965 [Chloroflexi bacterium RBG_19FT_COMBO_55_16]